MMNSGLSVWGAAVVLCMLGGVFALFSIVDRRLMGRMSRVLLYFGLSMLLVALYMWGLHVVHEWWAHVLWVLLGAVLVSWLILRKNRLLQGAFFVPVFVSVLVGMACGVGLSLLLAAVRPVLLVPGVVAVEAAFMIGAVSSGLAAYIRSLRHTQEHFQYLLANGASHAESVFPSVRRSLRAVVVPLLRTMTTPIAVAPPMLLCGLLMAGCAPLSSVLFVAFLLIAMLPVNVLTMALIILLADRLIFDRSGRFLL